VPAPMPVFVGRPHNAADLRKNPRLLTRTPAAKPGGDGGWGRRRVVFPNGNLDAAWFNALRAAMAQAYREIPGCVNCQVVDRSASWRRPIKARGSRSKSPLRGCGGLSHFIGACVVRATNAAGYFGRVLWRVTIQAAPPFHAHPRGRFFLRAAEPSPAPRAQRGRTKCCQALAADDPPGAESYGNSAPRRRRCTWSHSASAAAGISLSRAHEKAAGS
jgi:hypothetical protein